MLRTLATRTRSARRRSGAVLIVVLAMLVLFAVLGLSFVLYSEAQLSAARSQKLSVNEETEPNPMLASEGWMGPFIYDVSDTGNDLANPLRGNSLSRSKYGYRAGVLSLLPFGATNPIPQDPAGFNFNGITDSRQIVRFTWDQASNSVFDPERYYDFTNGAPTFRNNPAVALVDRTGVAGNNGTYVPKNYPFTYADRHDYYLAQMDPATGEVVVPSFHRPDLGSWNPAAANYLETVAGGKFKTLRPRVADGHVNFPPVPMNPDGTYTGDVANLKFIGLGTGQRNDSLWMDAGGPVLKWRGKFYKAMVAPLVLDLSGRVNLSTAGNGKGNGGTHGSNQGWGKWEVNPVQLGLTAADLTAFIQRRQGASANPPADPYTSATASTRVNRGRMPHQGSLIDADGSSTAANDPLVLPPRLTSFQPFPTFPATRFAPNAAQLTAELTNHPSQFNPLLYTRTPGSATAPYGGFGLDDFIKLYARYSDPKNRQAATTSVPTGTTLATSNGVRALTTTFSTSQQFATLDIATGAGTTVKLGPIDVNRPLTDYRVATTNGSPPSATNIATPTLATNGTSTAELANRDRQHLARDIFLRLAALPLSNTVGSLVDGTNVAYNTATGYLTVNVATPAAVRTALAQLAQVAANMVDYLDNDDVMTVFVWNPDGTHLPVNGAYPGALAAGIPTNPVYYNPAADPLNLTAAAVVARTVFGTEQPRLVINEAHVIVRNTAGDPLNLGRATLPYQRQHWVELHNPKPTNELVQSDAGAARLMNKVAVTASTAYTGGSTLTTYNPYRLEVAEVPTTAADQTPYTTYLTTTQPSPAAAVLDTTTVPGMTVRIQVNNYLSAGPPEAPAQEDIRYLVTPIAAGTASGTNGGNLGNSLVGPEDAFPDTSATPTVVTSTVRVPNAAAVPAMPVNAMQYPTSAGAPANADTTATVGTSSVFILRRLANPYLPPQTDPTLISTLGYYNPYLTVDYVEGVQTADRIDNDHTVTPHAAAAGSRDRATVGRDHPYSAAAFAAQTDTVNPIPTPIHTWFNRNSNLRNNRPVPGFPTLLPNGLVWFPHLDREAVNVLELLHVHEHSPARLTHLLTSANIQTSTYQWFRNGIRPTLLFDVLTTHTRLPGSPVGGREAGRINLNTINHQNVLAALFDTQTGNNFSTSGTFSPANLWAQLTTTGSGAERTPNGTTPRATVHEGGTDRPFRHSLLIPSGPSPVQDDSTFRAISPAPGTPVFLNNDEFTFDRSTYTQLEPLRKIWNSVTHTSDSFLVVMTVGFFEVTPTNAAQPIGLTNPPLFGAELFDKVSGDLRAQFAGVIDRSCLTLDTSATARVPYQTKLTADAVAGSNQIEIEAIPPGSALPTGITGTAPAAGQCAILGEGSALLVQANSGLRLGYGDAAGFTGDGVNVTVSAVAVGTKPGTALLTLTSPAPLPRHYGGGTLVLGTTTGGATAAVAFGNPGPQANVTLAQLKQRGLVPYFTRLEP